MASLFDDALRRINLYFTISGMHLEYKPSKTVYNVIRYRWYYIINFLWLNTEFVGEMLCLIDGAKKGVKLLELTYIAPCATLCMLASVKSIFLILNEDALTQLKKNLHDLEKDENGSEDMEKYKITAEFRSFLNVVISAIICSIFLSGGALCLTPLILMAVEFWKTNEIILLLPFPVVYPVDAYDIKYWPFVYLHQIWSSVIVASQIGGVDSLYYTCCTVIRAHFQSLQHDFEGIITGNEEEFQERLQKLVTRHQLLIRSASLLDVIYTKSTLFNFVSSSFIICLAGFNITAAKDMTSMLTFMAILTMNLLLIFLLCFFGNMIMTSSMELSNGIYNSKWYMLKPKTAKLLLLVQIRAQKPVTLTAYKFAYVNLQSFLNVLSTAWSYFALLNTINDG